MSLEREIDQRIAQSIRKWQQETLSPGAPLSIDEAWLQTPPHLRLPFQVLKTAGIPPQEVELFQQKAQLQAQLHACTDSHQAQQLRQQLSTVEQQLAIRLEALRQP